MNTKIYLAGQSYFASAVLVMLLLLLASPADAKHSTASNSEIYDPLESFNRTVFESNLVVDEYIVRPIAVGYRAVTTPIVRRSVRNVLNNLEEPLTVVHSLLQGDIINAGNATTRFLVNSVFGVFGLFDVAGSEGVTAHEEDLGQTLAVWGIGDGAFLMLPLLGPSTLRDGVGRIGDALGDPVGLTFEHNDWHWQRYTLVGLRVIDGRERSIELIDDLKRSSVDFYATIRNFYVQRRQAEILNTVGHSAAPGASSSVADQEFNSFLEEE